MAPKKAPDPSLSLKDQADETVALERQAATKRRGRLVHGFPDMGTLNPADNIVLYVQGANCGPILIISGPDIGGSRNGVLIQDFFKTLHSGECSKITETCA